MRAFSKHRPPQSSPSVCRLQNSINSTDPATHLPEPGSSQVCIIFLDDSTAVDDETAGVVMCEATSDNAFGYHTFFTTTAGNTFPFAVIPGLTDPCVTNSCPASLTLPAAGKHLRIDDIDRHPHIVGVDLFEHVGELQLPFFPRHITDVRRADNIVHAK